METQFLELIEWLKSIAPSLWNIAVKQVYLNSILSFVYAIILVVVSTILVRYLAKNWEKWDDSYDLGDTMKQAGFAVTTIIVLMVTVVFVINALVTFPQIFNVEYFAIQNLFNLLPQ